MCPIFIVHMYNSVSFYNHWKSSRAQLSHLNGLQVHSKVHGLRQLSISISQKTDEPLGAEILSEGGHDERVVDAECQDFIGSWFQHGVGEANVLWQEVNHIRRREGAWKAGQHDVPSFEVFLDVYGLGLEAVFSVLHHRYQGRRYLQMNILSRLQGVGAAWTRTIRTYIYPKKMMNEIKR